MHCSKRNPSSITPVRARAALEASPKLAVAINWWYRLNGCSRTYSSEPIYVVRAELIGKRSVSSVLCGFSAGVCSENLNTGVVVVKSAQDGA